MIDIHSHILPGLDDGAKDLEEALAMVELYLNQGFSGVLATPHWIDYQADIEAYEEAFKLLKDEMETRELALDLYKGHEFFITLGLAQDLERAAGHSLASGSYVLVEFPMFEHGNYFDSVLHELQLKGYRPILAHPERYGYVQKDPNLVHQWISRGILMQMNIPSLTGRHGKEVKKVAQILMDHDMVHFLATDSHSPRSRSPRVVEGLRGLLSQEELDLLLRENPLRIVQDREIEIVEPRLYKKKKYFFF